jgi:predicted ester cyclase
LKAYLTFYKEKKARRFRILATSKRVSFCEVCVPATQLEKMAVSL